jgi:NAD(P)H-dependent flavin oxidoreductase YrpB (nitropropane dioxygenase family)
LKESGETKIPASHGGPAQKPPRMKTRLTELLGVPYPIVQAPANFVGVPQLVAAVSNAGGFGILAPGRLAAGEIRDDIRAVRQLTDKPFGVNLIFGSPGYEKLAEVFLEEKVPLICHSRGNPKWLIDLTAGLDMRIMAMVGGVRHAIRAEQDGADTIMVQGEEAGGHVGHVSTIVLLPLIASRVRIPVVAAGGFSDGAGLVAALALGAEGIAMGTRFAVTQESPLPSSVKQRYLDCAENDTVVTPAITGTRLRVISNRFTQMLEEGDRPTSWREKISGAMETRRMLGVSWWRFLVGGWSMRKQYEASISELGHLAAGGVRIRKAMIEGDADLGVMPSGQVCGRIDDMPSVEELVDRTVSQAWSILGSLRDRTLPQ